jgi:hypothetical protein
MSVQKKPRFIRQKRQMRANFTAMKWLQKTCCRNQSCQPGHVVAKYELQSPCTAEVKAASSLWLLTIWRCRSLARGVSVISVVCFNPALTSSSFSSVSTLHFLAGFLSRSDTVDLTLLKTSWMAVVLGTVIPENLRRNFLRHFTAETHFTYDSYRKTRCSRLYRITSTLTIPGA